MNNKIYNISLACVAAVAMAACSDDAPSTPSTDKVDPNAHVITLTTEIQTKAPAGVKTEFSDTDEMNVFIKTSESPSGKDKVEGAIKATREGGVWKMNPTVTMSEGDINYVYAVAPYNAAYTDAAKIPVKITDQIDLLYSGGVACSYQTHNIRLTMKHALSLATFSIANNGYNGAGVINSVSINGEIVYTEGTLNAGTGRILGTKTDVVNIPQTAKVGGDKPAQMWVIPFNNQNKLDKSQFTAVIDGKTYNLELPEVSMRTGYQYNFKLTLSQYGLTFVPGGLEWISLNAEGDDVELPATRGVVTFKINSSKWEMPSFDGDNVFGTVSWGDNNATYNSGTSINTDGSTTVGIETWNSTGFTLDNLVGVEEIDITAY